jgi:hypothetical protein
MIRLMIPSFTRSISTVTTQNDKHQSRPWHTASYDVLDNDLEAAYARKLLLSGSKHHFFPANKYV